MPLLLQGRIGHIGDEVCVYTYHYVREDAVALFGFPAPEDQDMFELLLTVSGIGPKTAIAVVETLQPADLAMAVLSGDVKKICTVKGLGKKSAERIVLELKDKLKGFDQSGITASSDVPQVTTDKAANQAYEEGLDAEQLIRKALRILAK